MSSNDRTSKIQDSHDTSKLQQFDNTHTARERYNGLIMIDGQAKNSRIRRLVVVVVVVNDGVGIQCGDVVHIGRLDLSQVTFSLRTTTNEIWRHQPKGRHLPVYTFIIFRPSNCYTALPNHNGYLLRHIHHPQQPQLQQPMNQRALILCVIDVKYEWDVSLITDHASCTESFPILYITV